jgi:ankyrin repeat protein
VIIFEIQLYLIEFCCSLKLRISNETQFDQLSYTTTLFSYFTLFTNIGELGINPNAINKINGSTPLHSYLSTMYRGQASTHNINAIKQLINLNADVTIAGTSNRIPLSLVTSVDAAKILLEADGNTIKHQDKDQDTPLLESIKYNRHELVYFFITQSPQLHLHIQDAKGLNALQFCCKYYTDVKTIKLLLQNGAQVDIVDEYGNTPLMMFVGSSSCPRLKFQAIKWLLQHNANPTIQNHKQQTALHLLLSVRHEEDLDYIVEHLINYGLIEHVVDGENTP